MAKLSGKTAFVSASADGIGYVIAQQLLSDGAHVIICDISEDSLNKAQQENPQLEAYYCDVGDYESVSTMFSQILKKHAIDIVVNNAGIAGPTAELGDICTRAWSNCLRVGLDSHFYCSQLAVVGMKKRKHGVIINLTSTAGQHGFPNRSPYVAAKWAICGLTKTWAMELGRHNIRVNAIAPGSVKGERMQRVINAHAQLENRSPNEIYNEYCLGTSMQSFVSAEEIAALVSFLCSNEARHISGQIIAVDGNTETLHPRTKQ